MSHPRPGERRKRFSRYRDLRVSRSWWRISDDADRSRCEADIELTAEIVAYCSRRGAYFNAAGDVRCWQHVPREGSAR